MYRKQLVNIVKIFFLRFRWDYLPRLNQQSGNRGRNKNRVNYTGFDEFLNNGVHTKYIESVFPSESFPSWQTISTGWFKTFAITLMLHILNERSK